MGQIQEQIIELKNNNKVLIRTYEPSEAKNFEIYFPKVNEQSDFLVTEPGEYKPNPEMPKRINDFKEDLSSLIIVALSDNQVVGECSINGNSNKNRLKHRANIGLSVDKGWRGIGLGWRLMNICMNWATKANSSIEKLELNVFEGNLPAISMYEKLGFIYEGKTENAVKVGEGQYWNQINMYKYINT